MNMFEVLASTITFAPSDAPPTEFRIFESGTNTFEGKGTAIFDEAAAKAVMENATAHGVDKMIDLEHLSLDSESNNYNPDARGWLRLEVRETANGPELWATDVKWTSDGARRLTEKTQRYISPVFSVDSKTRRIMRVVNVALTALPATHETPALVAASERAASAAPCACHDEPAPDAVKDFFAMLDARAYLREKINNNVVANEKTIAAAAYPWDQCIADQLKRGHSEDSAKRICAYIKNQNASVDPGAGSKYRKASMALEGKDAELAGAWLTQLKTAAESAEDPTFKDMASKTLSALTELLGAPGAEAAAVAQAAQAQAGEAAVALAAAVRKLVGKEKPEEIAATISAWKQVSESQPDATELETLKATVAELTGKATASEIKSLLASNREKCNPAFEAWALKTDANGVLVRTSEDVAEALATREVVKASGATPPVAKGAGTPSGSADEVTLTKEDLQVCASLGTKPEDFLKHKIEISKSDRAQFMAGIGK